MASPLCNIGFVHLLDSKSYQIIKNYQLANSSLKSSKNSDSYVLCERTIIFYYFYNNFDFDIGTLDAVYLHFVI